MGVMIDWKNKTILDCSNSIFYGLYEDILYIIYNQNLSFNPEIKKLIDRLELCGDGWNINLAEYIHSKKNIQIFIDLVRQGIDRHYNEIPNLPQTTKDRLENFYDELVKIKQTLSD